MEESMIAKAAREQNQISQTPPEEPDQKVAVMDDKGLIRTGNAAGGFSAPAPQKKITAQPAAPPTPTIAELKAEIERLEQEQILIASQAAQPPQPQPDIPQPPQPTIQQPVKPQQLPDAAKLGGRTLFFGEASPAQPIQDLSPQQQPPTAAAHLPPYQQPTPQQPQQPVQQPIQQQPQQPAQPDGVRQNLVKTGDNYAYVAASMQFPGGMALVLDNINPKELDRYSYMAAYLSKVFPDAMPEPHPGLLLRFALDNLLFDIRKDTAEFTVCSQCNTKFSIMETNCPNCNNTNRCPTCKRLYGDNRYE
jgi:hypothetical protein